MSDTYCKNDAVILRHTTTDRPEPQKFERHCHRQYEMLYVTRGRGKCVVEASEYPLLAGSVFIFRPFEYHYVCPDPECVYERYVCNFDENILMDAVKKLPILNAKTQGICFAGGSKNSNFRNIFMSIGEFFEKSDPKSAESRAMAISTVNQLIILLSGEERAYEKTHENELVRGIIEYFAENMDKKISLDETAKRFFISKYYLCRVFREHTGVTVLSYLNSKRIAMAQHMIASGAPPTEAAYAVGFGDYSSFYRAYVKYAGHSPSEK